MAKDIIQFDTVAQAVEYIRDNIERRQARDKILRHQILSYRCISYHLLKLKLLDGLYVAQINRGGR